MSDAEQQTTEHWHTHPVMVQAMSRAGLSDAQMLLPHYRLAEITQALGLLARERVEMLDALSAGVPDCLPVSFNE